MTREYKCQDGTPIEHDRVYKTAHGMHFKVLGFKPGAHVKPIIGYDVGNMLPVDESDSDFLYEIIDPAAKQTPLDAKIVELDRLSIIGQSANVSRFELMQALKTIRETIKETIHA